MGERRGVCKVLAGKTEGNDCLEDPRVDNIKMDLQEVRWGVWTGLIWLRIGTGGGIL